MPANVPSARPRVLLLAGEVRDAWARALSDASFDVRTTGWLDAVTAARVDPPDVVVVSGDLPRNAPQVLVSAFRGQGFEKVPVVVAGLAPDEMERAVEQPLLLRADRYVPQPATADALVREVADAIRSGRVRWKPRPADVVALSFIALSLLMLGMRMLVNGFYGLSRGTVAPSALDRVVLLAALAAFAVGIGVALAAGRRVRTLRELRRTLPVSGWLLWLTGQLLREYSVVAETLFSAAALTWAAWAVLGLRVKPRSSAGPWLIVLAALLVLVAAAPWVALAWMWIG